MNIEAPMISEGVRRELLEVTAPELFIATGFDAVAGFPLPSGQLPVGSKALGMCLMRKEQWEEYKGLCAFHRAIQPLSLEDAA